MEEGGSEGGVKEGWREVWRKGEQIEVREVLRWK